MAKLSDIRILNVPDYTAAWQGIGGGSACGNAAPNGVNRCTRMPRHTGRHAAGDAERILFTWPTAQSGGRR